MSTRSDLLDVVLAYLREEGRRFERLDDETPTLRLGHEGRSGRWIYYVRILPEDRDVVVYSVFPRDAPEDRRAAMMECLTRINSGLTVGAIELDLEDGEILARTSISARGAALTPALVRNLIEDNLLVMDTYFPALLDVVTDRRSPAEAVARAEDEAPGVED